MLISAPPPFQQIDPEEHAQALASVEQMKEECKSMKGLKDKAEKDSSSAKGLVAQLNKEISSQKASMDAFKTALEKTKAEKEKLSKAAQLNDSKKVAEAQAALKASKAELDASNAVSCVCISLFYTLLLQRSSNARV